METDLKLVRGKDSEEEIMKNCSPEEKLRHFRNVTGFMLEDALKVWADIYSEFEGTVTYGTMITADARKGFKPDCGWPEFLEKMRRLEHYLDHAKRICEGRA